MKKILLAFDGSNFSEGAFEFANRLNKAEPILLTGIFIPQVNAKNIWAYSVGVPPAVVPVLEEEVIEEEKNMERFKDLCEMYKIRYKVHEDYYGFAIPELKRETRFADLLIIGSETFYRNIGPGMNDYMLDALHKAECPVLLVPENFIFPQNNILAYDGSESSVYAIKQFAYLFPELTDLATLLVFFEKKEEGIPESQNVQELVSQHFSNVEILKLDMDLREFISADRSEKLNSILVSGSFGRSVLSQAIRKSFVSDIIREHKLPVFIAHK